jgi:hypothetical protein
MNNPLSQKTAEHSQADGNEDCDLLAHTSIRQEQSYGRCRDRSNSGQ